MTVMETKQVTRTDVLHRAADLIEEFGHCQRLFADFGLDSPVKNHVAWTFYKEGRLRVSRVPSGFCMSGAYAQAWVDLTGLESMNPDELEWIDWNDTPGRTKAEVVGRLRELAKEADRERG